MFASEAGYAYHPRLQIICKMNVQRTMLNALQNDRQGGSQSIDVLIVYRSKLMTYIRHGSEGVFSFSRLHPLKSYRLCSPLAGFVLKVRLVDMEGSLIVGTLFG